MKTIKMLAGLMLGIMLTNCLDENIEEKVWRIKALHRTGGSRMTINLNYNKSGGITSVDQTTDGVTVTFYPSRSGNNIILNYESTSGPAERIFTFTADSALMSIYEANSTDINRKFMYEPYNGGTRMVGYFTSKLNGDTVSMRKFLWSGNEIPQLISYGYIDGVRDEQGELVNMLSEEVVNPTYVQFPVELSVVLFNQEEYLMYGLANPAKFQMRAENTDYSDLQFDRFGHWIGYTRNQSGAGNDNVEIVWEEGTINR